ncbi:putative F-box protein At1g49610 isoform X1 [Lycium barbarum]|uniref:putative F-box protein At1g49610 isoform X1 n=2 Tax=Lycium barbarum TaxID=112863 RepID=UPI00293E9208|nr:putative F-box protein At1g49610 isoform X1 [Lycium barbarum]
MKLTRMTLRAVGNFGIVWLKSSGMNMSTRQRSSDFDEDHISRLPDAILIHILSLLPSTDAVNTILIKRFHQLWPFIHTLTFDQCTFPGHNCVYYWQTVSPEYDERFLNFVRHVLLRNRSPTLDKFCLDFHFSLCHSIRQRVSNRTDNDFLRSEKRMANEIGTWIQFALNKNLKVLDLSFSAHGTYQPQAYYDLPNCVLSSPHLAELRLTQCKIKTKKKSALKSLTTLYLDNVMLIDQSMDYILSGCPMLEELTLWFCYGHRRVVVVNSNLKTLVLGVRWFGTRIHVSCPTLISLNMFGTVEVLDITNVSSIVEVSVNRRERFDFRQYKDYQEMRVLLQTISGAKSLQLCSWFALVFSSWQLTNLLSPTFSCKSLHLRLNFVKWHLPGILNLLKHCPCLENLIIDITYYDESTSQDTLSWIHPYEFDADEYWNTVDTPVQCLTHHLKTVEIAGHVMEKQVVPFLEYLLGHCMVLEKMMIYAEEQTWTCGPINLSPDNVHEYEERLMNAPIASASAEVLIY